MITNVQALELYWTAQLTDHRDPPPDHVLTLWREVSKQGKWTYEQGMRAIIEHRTYKPGEYFEPGHITKRVMEVRKEIGGRWYCPDPPDHLFDDPRAEIEWRRRAQQEFMNRNLALWAEGEPFESINEVLGLENEKRGALPAAAAYDSPAKRAALEEIRKFSTRTRIPKEGVSEEERIRARDELRRKRWEAVDACGQCDDEGLNEHGFVCDHVQQKGSAA
jgi:hypothetical protein